MKYLEITIKLNRCAIEAALAALDMIGAGDAEVRDPHDAEEIMADKETYEWDYVDSKVAEDIGKTPEIHIYHELTSDQNPVCPEAVFAAASGELHGTDQSQSCTESDEGEEFIAAVKGAMEKLKKDFHNGVYGMGQDPGEITVTSEVKDDSIWKDKWKEFFRPSHISDRIVVKPTWEEYEPADDEIVIEIDPGMAFGTGTHETTSMCIRALEKYITSGASMLDAGCGSGILSIAAAKLGASCVLGVDIDEEAVRVSEENFRLNGTSDVCQAVIGDVTKGIEYPAGRSTPEAEPEIGEAGEESRKIYQADVVAANLMAELLCMIAKGLSDHMKNGGVLVSSGILNEKEEMVRSAFEGAGLSIAEVMHDGEWCCIIANKEK